MKVKVDQVDVEEEDYSFLVIYAEHNGDTSCSELENVMVDDHFEIEGEPSYSQIWYQVCKTIFGSWFVRSKYIVTGGWLIFYPISKIKFLAKIQKNHFEFTANMATLEMERITTLINNKYGEQIVLDMQESC